jgi:hypothetical protein
MRTLLHDAAFGRGWGDRIDERQVRRLVIRGLVLLADGRALAAHG